MLLIHRVNQLTRRDPVEVGLLICSELLHRKIALLPSSVALHQNAGYDDEEDEEKGNCKTDEHDKANGKMVI